MKRAVAVWALLFGMDVIVYFFGWWNGLPLPVSLSLLAVWNGLITFVARFKR